MQKRPGAASLWSVPEIYFERRTFGRMIKPNRLTSIAATTLAVNPQAV